jgi:monothiol glutaredoxin
MNNKFEEIKEAIQNNDVVLYMKGSPSAPHCGFSATVAFILQKLNVPVKHFDILQDQELREAIKVYSDWPTIPQLYIKGEFIGGCDIVKEMYETGELQQALQSKGIIVA